MTNNIGVTWMDGGRIAEAALPFCVTFVLIILTLHILCDQSQDTKVSSASNSYQSASITGPCTSCYYYPFSAPPKALVISQHK